MKSIKVVTGPALLALMSCTNLPTSPPNLFEKDPHSFSNPDQVAVSHVDLDLTVDFKTRTLKGTAALTIHNHKGATEIVLDSHGLVVRSANLDKETPTTFALGEGIQGLGQPLRIQIRPDTRTVTLAYETSPGAGALQWLSPEQTANKVHPFLYSQSQPVFARTWIPCQDSPGTRFTYQAKIRVPSPLLAVMSAKNPQKRNRTGVYAFEMPQPIPAYLLALAVGDLQYRAYDGRSGVYAESSVIEKSHHEFVDVPKMIEVAESLFGPYLWGQYDLLVLPPSFPFGGMENPRLSFITPSLLAGDRSLVNVVSHELAHSWTGNLVTNANLNHFWLNEGFTVFAERRILEALAGVEARELQAKNGETGAIKEIEGMKETPEYTKLRMRLASTVNPDDAFSSVPYEKGYLFLRHIESQVGREVFDGFIRQYIETFKWQAVNTEQFLAFLEEKLIRGNSVLREQLRIQQWIYEPGMPEDRPAIESKALASADVAATGFVREGIVDMAVLGSFSAYQWLRFLSKIPTDIAHSKLEKLDKAARLSRSRNSEITFAWLSLGLQARYAVSLRHVEIFLASTGRGKFVGPLFKQLIQRDDTLEMARSLYLRLKPGYHAIVQNRIENYLRDRK